MEFGIQSQSFENTQACKGADSQLVSFFHWTVQMQRFVEKIYSWVILTCQIYTEVLHLSMDGARFLWSRMIPCPGGLWSPEYQCSNCVLMRCNISSCFHLRIGVSCSTSKLQLWSYVCHKTQMKGHTAFAPSKKEKQIQEIHLLILFEGFQWSIPSQRWEPQRFNQ